MKISTQDQYFGWVAVDEDSYDGPGSPIGIGATEQEAIDSLMEQLADDSEPDPRWDEDQYLDDPRHNQARGLNRENRGRS
jgi:hypothetical protein